jgi:hypothetical protein
MANQIYAFNVVTSEKNPETRKSAKTENRFLGIMLILLSLIFNNTTYNIIISTNTNKK